LAKKGNWGEIRIIGSLLFGRKGLSKKGGGKNLFPKRLIWTFYWGFLTRQKGGLFRKNWINFWLI